MSLTRRGKWVVGLTIVFILVGVPLIGGYMYLRSLGVFGESDPGKAVSLVIPKGAGAETIGKILEQKGVIASAFGFRIATYLEEGIEDVQAGRYQIRTGLTAADALAALTQEGPLGEEFVTVTFPEGSWLEDFAANLDEDTHLSGDRFLQLLESGDVTSALLPDGITNMEGLLFPSTYQVIKKDTERSVAQRLVGEMEKVVEDLDLESKAQQLGITPYEAIIVASMIEAETRIDDERPMVARVIYNRLDDDIALGIDATVLYAIGEHKEVLTESDLAVESPYNTRKVAGLPPTPIGAPGRAALEAAVNPADGEWLYYVLADCEGNHSFSVDYDDFLQDKAAYQQLDC